ncbi:MAG: zinc ribbon domain-containing protein [Chloroflexia bacterium]
MLTDTKEGEVEGLLREGQEAARRGDVITARSFLSQVVERDSSNEVAWMWLSGVVEDVAEQQICLENVLVINPENSKARKGLDYLQSQASATQADTTSAAPAYAAEYEASPAEYTTPSQDDMPHQEHTATAEPAGGDSMWEDSNSEEGFDISGLELQTSPTLEGSLPWLQVLEQQNNGTGHAANGSTYEPAVAALPLDAAAMFGATVDEPPASSPMNDISFAGVVGDKLSTEDVPSDVKPFTAEQNELPMFDFSSFTDTAAPAQTNSQSGGDSSVDFGNPHFNFEEHVAAQTGADATSNSGFMPLPAGGFNEMMNGPMGPMSEVNLPAPSELPGYKGEAGDPWYLESSEQPAPIKVNEPAGVPLYSSSLTPEHMPRDPSAAKNSMVTMIKCPNCREDVADTSLACPNCRFNFFINCPSCHELVDASEAAQGKAEQCPHCSASINLLQLGQSGVDGAAQYQSTKLANVASSSLLATSLDTDLRPRTRVGFGWVVDIVWLVTIIAIVWALTQLPTWLHLTGQY